MQKEYPSLAEIVRQETDGGRLIVQFYLGVAWGDIEGFRDHHRAAAARRIDKIAPDLVKEYLHKYHNDACRDYFARSLFPMGRIEPMQPNQAEPVPRGPNAFQRRLRQHVRNETADGRNIVLFLIGVMDGTLTGFKPHHRLEAARELAAYITNPSVVPAQAGTQRGGAGRSASSPRGGRLRRGLSPAAATKPETQNRGNTAVVPAKAGTQRGGEGRSASSPRGGRMRRGLSPAAATKPATQNRDNTPVVPAKAEPAPYSIRGTQRGEDGRSASSPRGERSEPVLSLPKGRGLSLSPSAEEGQDGGDSPAVPTKPDFPPITIEELERFDFTREHAAQYNFARDEITGGIYGYDELGPFVADEEGEIHHIDPSRVAGYERVVRSSPATPEPSATRSGRGRRGSRPSQAKDRNPRVRTSPHPRTLNRRRKNSSTQSRRSKVATGTPLSTPGRSPPKIWV